jgi:multidrug resistance efflux pump
LDIGASELAELEHFSQKQLEEVIADVAKADAEATLAKSRFAALRQKAALLRGQLAPLRAQLGNLQKTINQITVKLEESKLGRDSTEELLLSLI